MLERLEDRRVLSTTTLYPDADTYTQAGVGAGAATTLVTRDRIGASDYMAYVRFDLSGIDLEGLTDARLTMQKVSGATIVIDRFDVYGLANLPGNTPQDWNELTLAEGGLGAEYANTAGTLVDLTRVINLSPDGTSGVDTLEQVTNSGAPQHLIGVDLVNFLATRKADGGLATFIVVIDAGADRTFEYGSRENADVSLRPTLSLEYTPAYAANPVVLPKQVEFLNRGVVAMRRAAGEVYVGWRMLGDDPASIAFNLYRRAGSGAAIKLNATPITSSTNFVDTTFTASSANSYYVRSVVDGVEQEPSESFTLAANAPLAQHLDVALQVPPSGLAPVVGSPGQFVSYSYTANDASAADLDGDGEYEIILKWMPTNEAHAGADGFTGPMLFDAYKLDGTLLWRINLGTNIRAAAQYSAFLVYDFDGDGRAEFVSRTMPGTKDGLGQNVVLPGDDPSADYRSSTGRILTGPEYLTVFDGLTGAALATVPFTPERDDISTWGDDYGHRGENILMAPAYLDGQRPSIVVGRGIFPPNGTFPVRNELAAWNWRDGQLTQQWHFRAAIGVFDDINSEHTGQGVYNMIPADVDGDGRDEIVFGAMVVDDDGTGLYSTGRGHGDALHVSDMSLSNPGLEVFMPQEFTSIGNHAASILRDAATGRALAAPLVSPADVAAGTYPDVGRGIALDIDPNYPGYEFWDSYSPSIYSADGTAIYAKPSNMHQNFGVWWDADLLRETLDGTTISDWNYTTRGRQNLVSFANSGINSTAGLSANNGTKNTPTLVADLFGDWREEVVWRSSDNTRLQVWSTTIVTSTRLITLMHDIQYREAVAWQNVGYNQPPNPSYFLGAGMAPQPTPPLFFGGELKGDYNGDGVVDAADYTVWRDALGSTMNLAADGDHNGVVDADDHVVWAVNLGATKSPGTSFTLAKSASLAADGSEVRLAWDGSIGTTVVTPIANRWVYRPAVRNESSSLPSRIALLITPTATSADTVFADDATTTSRSIESEAIDVVDAVFAGLSRVFQ